MIDNLLAKFEDVKARRAEGEGGFTLIELLVVVVIIGILIAIAIPLYLNYQKGSKDKSAQSDLRGAVSALQQCYTENSNSYPAVPSGNGGEGTDLVFTCGTGTPTPTETAKVSDGTKLTYTVSSDKASFTLKASNTGGTGKEYTYDSTAGGKIG